MKRRDFVIRSVGVALAGAVPLAAHARRRAPLLDDPSSWRGETFMLDDGSRLQLADVEHCRCDRHSTQTRLRFRLLDGMLPSEGSHRLRASGCEQMLFLQIGREGPVACLNRLHLG